MDSPRGLTLFDFDGTLTRHDTLFMFARHLLGRRRVRAALLRSLPAIMAWKLGIIDNGTAKHRLFTNLFQGIPMTEFERAGESFADVIDTDLRREGMEGLRLARERGDEIAIVSASFTPWIRPWAMRNGIDRVIATVPETDGDGRLTGAFATPNCHGTEKTRRVREAFPDIGCRHVTAYGDSSADRPMLELAQTPVMLRKRPFKDIMVFLVFLGVSMLLAFSLLWAYDRYITSPPYVDPARFPVRGIDVSAHNGMMNLDAAADYGIEFIYIKATEGSAFRDTNFALNYLKAGHAGMKRGAYHFFRFDADGISQAKNLLRAIAGRPLELGIAIDVEEQGNPSGIPADSISLRLRDMVDFLLLNGQRVTFYSNRDGYSRYIMPDFPGYPLWICDFNSRNAMNPDWQFWQYDHRGRVPGIRTDVDLNVFAGSREEWERFSVQ